MKHLLLRQKQVLYFIIAGGLSAIVEIGMFKIFSICIPKVFSEELDFHGINYPLSLIFSTICAIIFNYWLSIWFVFERGKHSKKKEFAYFMFISFLSTIVSFSLFQVFFNYVFKDNLDLKFFVFSPEILSKTASIFVVSILNYSVKKRIIFNA